ncbi:MAG: hypothetical protein B7X09_00010 [Acidiphilium sp. 21-66-27]|nr:MAG: hypothetical protein B7X09_00010 [Acidiphilium sp. 21-66-27]
MIVRQTGQDHVSHRRRIDADRREEIDRIGKPRSNRAWSGRSSSLLSGRYRLPPRHPDQAAEAAGRGWIGTCSIVLTTGAFAPAATYQA